MATWRTCFALLLPGAALCGCLGPPAIVPVPLAGPAPRSIAVWPWIAAPVATPEAVPERILLAGLDRALLARGYRVQASAVVQHLLEAVPVPADLESPWAIVGRELGVDAVLQFGARRFTRDLSRSGWLQSAAWECEWRLLATADGAVLWQHEQRGAWRRADLEPDSNYPRDDLLNPSPFGPALPSFRSLEELLEHLHWQALQRLPVAVRQP